MTAVLMMGWPGFRRLQRSGIYITFAPFNPGNRVEGPIAQLVRAVDS